VRGDKGLLLLSRLYRMGGHGSKMRMKRLDIYIQFEKVNRETEDWAWDSRLEIE